VNADGTDAHVLEGLRDEKTGGRTAWKPLKR
jgi:hypothetical protein